MPAATNAKVRRNSVQSKCEIRRRSICTNLPVRAHLLLVRGLFLLLNELLEHFFRHRRCGFPAMPAMLDQDCNRDLWIFNRRIGYKPGVISIEVGKLFALEVSALHLDNLRGAGLTRNFD